MKTEEYPHLFKKDQTSPNTKNLTSDFLIIKSLQQLYLLVLNKTTSHK